MNYSTTINNKKVNALLSIFVTSALILAPLLASDNVFAQGGVNSANQGIGQSQANVQNALCLSGALTGPACNNTSVQGQSNTGSNTAGQTAGGGTGKHGSGGVNSANQGIGQSQSNQQSAQCVAAGSLGNSCKGNPNATCVSGKDKIVSCTPEEFQKLINSGKTLTANLSNQH